MSARNRWTNGSCELYTIHNVKSCSKKELEDVGRLSSSCGVCL
jgi:hypothetical protein